VLPPIVAGVREAVAPIRGPLVDRLLVPSRAVVNVVALLL
jgi:hypothetical protein